MVADRDTEPPPRSQGREHSLEAVSALLGTLAVWIASVVASGAALAGWVLLTTPGASVRNGLLREWITSHSGTVEGVLLLVLPGQAVFLAGSWYCARRFRERPLERLGLGSGSTSTAVAILCVLGTIGIQWASALALDLVFEEPSSSMVEIWRMLSTPTGIPAVAIGITISLVPGVCEEVLFRGLLQRGLVKRTSPLLAIAIAAVAFALAHLDVQHALGVLPLGLWLGFVAWRTGSIRLAIACHVANNLSAIVFGRAFGDPDTGTLPRSAAMTLAGVALCLCALAGARGLRPARPRNPETGSQMVQGGN